MHHYNMELKTVEVRTVKITELCKCAINNKSIIAF